MREGMGQPIQRLNEGSDGSTMGQPFKDFWLPLKKYGELCRDENSSLCSSYTFSKSTKAVFSVQWLSVAHLKHVTQYGRRPDFPYYDLPPPFPPITRATPIHH